MARWIQPIIKNVARTAKCGLALAALTGRVWAATPNVVTVPGVPTLLLGNYELAPLGYRADEFFVSGTATSYKLAGAPAEDGRWSAEPDGTAPYTTRIVVVRPTDAKKFNGTVVVEWLNVSAGADGSPDWNMMQRELIRSGYAYIGVSAQKAGIEGGGLMAVAGAAGLKKTNPERYSKLSHPGDSYSYDIFSQVRNALRDAGSNQILGPLVPKRFIAVGESQSAVFLTTYINAIDPLVKTYDGYLVHSRFGGSASLANAAMFGLGGPRYVKFRPDLRVPVLTVITETDLLDGNTPGYNGARQPDHDKLRVWEVPGTAHADMYSFSTGHIDSGLETLEKLAEANASSKDVLGGGMSKPVNNAWQHHYVVEAALASLDRWVRTNQPAPAAMPMKLTQGDQAGARASLVLDANGLAEGGVRTPWMDVPTEHLAGYGNSGGQVAFMAGVGELFDTTTLNRLYPGGKTEYLKKFEASLDSAIKAGFILTADRRKSSGSLRSPIKD